MNTPRRSMLSVLALSLALAAGTPAGHAQNAPSIPVPSFESTKDWLKSFTDPKWGSTFSSVTPSANQITAFLGILSNPKMMEGMLNMADPELMTEWMKAATNPAFFNALISMGNPALMTSYVNMLGDPRIMETMMKMGDPKVVEPFMNIMTNPSFIKAMTKMADPKL
ncbi:MAG TPA: hypothetical protein ENJ62_01095, partial [Bryobacterales bacterium]|nr:hypothetical protein [Bryobacterales bacterium]